MALDRIQFENWVPKLVDYLKDNHIVDDEKIKAIEEEIENLRNDESKSLTAEYYEPVISNIVKMVLPVELFNVGTTTFDDSIKTIVHNYMTQEISETSSASVVDMPVTKALFGLFDVSTLNTILKVDKDFVAPKE